MKLNTIPIHHNGKQDKIKLWSRSFKSGVIYAFPLGVVLADMIVNGGPVPKVFVTGRTAVLRGGTEVDFAHVTPHVDKVANAPPANHADETPVARLDVALDEFIHRSYKGTENRASRARQEPVSRSCIPNIAKRPPPNM